MKKAPIEFGYVSLTGKSFRACSATFTFVSLDKKGQTIQIPELKVETDVEKLRFGLARKRYTAKKESRKRKAETINQNSSTERQMSVNWILSEQKYNSKSLFINFCFI